MPLTHEQNDDIPEGRAGARFICDRTALHAVSRWLSQNRWVVVTSEPGYLPKRTRSLRTNSGRRSVNFSNVLMTTINVHRVWAAVN